MQPPPSPLNLLRALLRECSYLPDPAARTHWHTHVLSRFRAYCPRHSPVPWWDRPPQLQNPKSYTKVLVALTPQRIAHLFRQGRKSLHILERANAGHINPLKKVLAHTYGRTGPRRHQLLANFEALSTPTDQEALEALSTSLTKSTPVLSEPRPLSGSSRTNPPSLPSDTSQLLPHTFITLLKSQRSQNSSRLSYVPLKIVEPVFPTTNNWGRPMPVKRARNIEKKWVALAKESVLPPLPREEWEQLKSLVEGTVVWEGPRKRRPRGSSEKASDRSTVEDAGKTSDKSTREEVQRGMRRVNGQNPHTLTPRFMRRMWAKIFAACPIMLWHPDSQTWTVRWGTGPGQSSALRAAASMQKPPSAPSPGASKLPRVEVKRSEQANPETTDQEAVQGQRSSAHPDSISSFRTQNHVAGGAPGQRPVATQATVVQTWNPISLFDGVDEAGKLFEVDSKPRKVVRDIRGTV
ncbi:hypothetical protein MMC19_002511 [Ptychographa xylographoides]|nr:hypothetical protein [Ptychographa xylographoides]